MHLREPLRGQVSPDSPQILVAVNGAGIVESTGMEPVSFTTGDAVVIPACVSEYNVRPQWELDVMRMSLPGGPVVCAPDRPDAIAQPGLVGASAPGVCKNPRLTPGK